MLLFARGIAGTGLHFVCVGTSTGSVLVFDVPAKGTNITLSEVLEQHSSPITDIGAELCEQPEGAADLVTADDSGALCVWGSGETFRLITKIPASEYGAVEERGTQGRGWGAGASSAQQQGQAAVQSRGCPLLVAELALLQAAMSSL
ncbi:WD repeat-containing protein 54 [Ophiophagus hannah]|uniref:WD repeat-containing protein 54 n=1 Tax=Ophiophagus hannah TaxID=8665 RepID=V8NB71_OPHHA|nr:WD repeat-containing protein 54 [Ophiophagus hannah]